MDNFFELLPFIIGILYFVFGKGKKKKESPKPRHPRPKTSSSTPSIEDILRELTGESPQKSKPEPEPVYTPEPETPVPFEPVYEGRKSLETIQPEVKKDASGDYEHSSAKMKALELVDFVELDDDEDEGPSIEIDLRQAVIYDAILNRPYP